jgi:D-glycero-D-manno-heptose 1,7-bisphosphate phosphatase
MRTIPRGGRISANRRSMKSAVFFERDGVLNLVETQGQQQIAPKCVEEFRPNPDAKPVLARLKRAGFLILVTTNQPGVAHGYIPRRELDRMHELLRGCLPVDDIFVCIHDGVDGCPCRKPQTGLLTEAAFKYHLNLEQCFVVSDKWHDAQAAHRVGAISLLLQSPWIGKGHHDVVLPTLEAIGEKILSSRPNLAAAVS